MCLYHVVYLVCLADGFGLVCYVTFVSLSVGESDLCIPSVMATPNVVMPCPNLV